VTFYFVLEISSMKIGTVKIALLVSLALIATGCTCRTKKVVSENIASPVAGDILKDVNFAFDSYALDEGSKMILNTNADWLKANPAKTVQVEGHCDDRGTNEYNLALGAKRAQASFNYLRSLGVDASRLSTISYGEELPLDPRHNEEAYAKNRRDHFKITN
jgi:peptidoglycan-associated lipoprotein